MIRVCPERDATCPHGMNCPYADTRYSCKEGWQAQSERDRVKALVREAIKREPTDFFNREDHVLGIIADAILSDPAFARKGEQS